MTGCVPIADEEAEISSGGGVGDRDDGPGVYVERPKASGGSVHARGGEVGVAAYLILSLELIRVVQVRRDGAVSSQYSVLPRILSLLYPIP